MVYNHLNCTFSQNSYPITFHTFLPLWLAHDAAQDFPEQTHQSLAFFSALNCSQNKNKCHSTVESYSARFPVFFPAQKHRSPLHRTKLSHGDAIHAVLPECFSAFLAYFKALSLDFDLIKFAFNRMI